MSRIESIDLCLLVLVVVYVGMYIFSWGHAETLLKQGRAADKSCMDSTYHYEYPPDQKPVYVQGDTEKCTHLIGYVGHGFLFMPSYKHI